LPAACVADSHTGNSPQPPVTIAAQAIQNLLGDE